MTPAKPAIVAKVKKLITKRAENENNRSAATERLYRRGWLKTLLPLLYQRGVIGSTVPAILIVWLF